MTKNRTLTKTAENFSEEMIRKLQSRQNGDVSGSQGGLNSKRGKSQCQMSPLRQKKFIAILIVGNVPPFKVDHLVLFSSLWRLMITWEIQPVSTRYQIQNIYFAAITSVRLGWLIDPQKHIWVYKQSTANNNAFHHHHNWGDVRRWRQYLARFQAKCMT